MSALQRRYPTTESRIDAAYMVMDYLGGAICSEAAPALIFATAISGSRFDAGTSPSSVACCCRQVHGNATVAKRGATFHRPSTHGRYGALSESAAYAQSLCIALQCDCLLCRLSCRCRTAWMRPTGLADAWPPPQTSPGLSRFCSPSCQPFKHCATDESRRHSAQRIAGVSPALQQANLPNAAGRRESARPVQRSARLLERAL